MQEIRHLINQYDGAVTLGEISSEDSLATMSEYTSGGDKLHMGYSFELLTKDYSPEYIKQTVETLESQMTEGWPCWAFSNHDVERVASRWSKNSVVSQQQVKMLHALLGSLRGSICLYQGEELGLGEATLTFEQLQDPYGITFWPNFKGRDGCRTPMPWTNEDIHGGFTKGDAWLPVVKEHVQNSVSNQTVNEDSALNHCQAFLAWRKTQPVLLYGSIKFIDADKSLLCFERTHENVTVQCFFNLSDQAIVLENELSPIKSLNYKENTLNAYGYVFSVK